VGATGGKVGWWVRTEEHAMINRQGTLRASVGIRQRPGGAGGGGRVEEEDCGGRLFPQSTAPPSTLNLCPSAEEGCRARDRYDRQTTSRSAMLVAQTNEHIP